MLGLELNLCLLSTSTGTIHRPFASFVTLNFVFSLRMYLYLQAKSMGRGQSPMYAFHPKLKQKVLHISYLFNSAEVGRLESLISLSSFAGKVNIICKTMSY